MPRKPSATDCLQAKNPAVAAQWHPTWNADKTPQDYLAGSGFRAWWLCLEGHRWRAKICSRTTPGRGTGCPYCAGTLAWPGFNDLATVEPELVATGWDVERNAPLRATHVTAGSKKRVWWRCQARGHSWQAAVHTRVAGHGCPTCAGKLVEVGWNDLATLRPDIAAQAVGWDPSTVTVSSGLKKRWRCAEGHLFYATPHNRTTHESGCPGCSKYHKKGKLQGLARGGPPDELPPYDPSVTRVMVDLMHGAKLWMRETGDA